MSEKLDMAVWQERFRQLEEDFPELPRKSVKEVRDFAIDVYEKFKNLCRRLEEEGEEEKVKEFIWIMGPMVSAAVDLLKKVETITGETFE